VKHRFFTVFPRWLQKLVGAEYRTVAQVHNAYSAGRIPLERVARWYKDEGYNPHYAELCLKWLQVLKDAEEVLDAGH
jgi:hypothetical protein